MIILVMAMIFLPFIARLINKVFPFTFGCLSYRFLGNPCPLCGFTRDIKNIISGNIFAYKYNLISTPAVFLGIIELIGRIKLLGSKEKLLNDKYRNNVIKFDIIYHLGIYFLFILYVALFYIFDLARVG
ncbi:hypothetical protein [Clostridium sp.]|uniref:hypothetical protein n=1 Tax=Clostridium sp. TaxID=1506 RepID=UPI00321648D4